jgi:hypothetical protein
MSQVSPSRGSCSLISRLPNPTFFPRCSGDPVDRCTDYRKARIDHCIAAYPDNELLIESEHSHGEQHRAEHEFRKAAPR